MADSFNMGKKPVVIESKTLYKTLAVIALPMAMQELISCSLNFVDNLMVGSLGETELSAVGVGVQVFFIHWMVLFGFVSGTATFTAQFFGSGEIKNIRKTIASAESVQIHLSGEKNILDFPEFSDIDKARTLFNTLEEKEALLNIIGDTDGRKTDVSIGAENELEEMKNCSVIKTSYKVGDDVYGTIGIIGPTRMDYGQVISVLNGMAKNIENIMNSASKRRKRAIERKDKLNE